MHSMGILLFGVGFITSVTRWYVVYWCWSCSHPFSFWTFTFTGLKHSDFQILHWSIWHILAMQWQSYWFRVRRCRQFSTRTIQQGINNLILIVSKPSVYNCKFIVDWVWKMRKEWKRKEMKRPHTHHSWQGR